MPGSPDFGPSSTVLAFTRAARAARYTVSITSVFEPDEESVRAATESLLGQHVEAIIVVADDRRVLERGGVGSSWTCRWWPSTPLGGRVRRRSPSTSTEVPGRRPSTWSALGHTTIVHLAGPANSTDGGERERGWRDVLAEHGLVSSPPLFGDWTPDSGYRLVTGGDRPRLHGDLLRQRPDGVGSACMP